MKFLRKTALIISSTLLKLSLYSLVLVLALIGVLGTPDKVKQSLDQSQVYGQVVDAALESATKDSQDDGAISLGHPEVQTAAKSAFTPVALKGWTEEIIDGVYGWLEGKTARPEFQVDLTAAKQSFIQEVADQAESRLLGLPACTTQQALELRTQQINPFTVPCRPPVDIAAQKQRIITELGQNQEFLGDTVITADDLSAENQISFQDSELPEAFQRIQELPLGLVLFSIILASIIIFSAPTKRIGIKKVAFSLLATGAFLLVSALIFIYIFNSLGSPDGKLDNMLNVEGDGLKLAILDIVGSLSEAFNISLLKIAAVYIVLGGAGLLALHLSKPRGKESYRQGDAEQMDSHSPIAASPKSEDKLNDKN